MCANGRDVYRQVDPLGDQWGRVEVNVADKRSQKLDSDVGYTVRGVYRLLTRAMPVETMP
ncbi:hypothetical protein L195_g060787, partial [Trifolium pratense]